MSPFELATRHSPLPITSRQPPAHPSSFLPGARFVICVRLIADITTELESPLCSAEQFSRSDNI